MDRARVLSLLLCSTLLSLAGCDQPPDLAAYVKGTHGKRLDQLNVIEVTTSPGGAAVRVRTRQTSTCIVYVHGGWSQVIKIPELAEQAGCDERSFVVPNVWLKEYNGDNLLTAILSDHAQLRMHKDGNGAWTVTYEGPRGEGQRTVDLALDTVVALAEFQRQNKPQTAKQLVSYLNTPIERPVFIY